MCINLNHKNNMNRFTSHLYASQSYTPIITPTLNRFSRNENVRHSGFHLLFPLEWKTKMYLMCTHRQSSTDATFTFISIYGLQRGGGAKRGHPPRFFLFGSCKFTLGGRFHHWSSCVCVCINITAENDTQYSTRDSVNTPRQH